MNKKEALRDIYYLEANLAFYGGLYATDNKEAITPTHFKMDTKDDIKTLKELKTFISSFNEAPIECSFRRCIQKTFKNIYRNIAKKIDFRLIFKPNSHLHSGWFISNRMDGR